MLNLSGGTCQKIMRYNLKRLTELSRLCLKCNKRKKCSYAQNGHDIQPLLQKFTPICKQQNQELLLFIVRGIRSQLKLPLLLTSSAHSPPAPPRPISYSITQIVIARTQWTMCILGLFRSRDKKKGNPIKQVSIKKLQLTSKNTPNSVSGIFRASFGEASILRVAFWFASKSDARHLQTMQKRSKKWMTVRESPSMEPIHFNYANYSFASSMSIRTNYIRSC